MAYEMIDRLTAANEFQLLNKLSATVEQKRRENNKKHEVWELSFDWKECRGEEFRNQKLNYINNP